MKTSVEKFLVCYNEESQYIILRRHHFDWKEGEVITTNGLKTVIFGIFEGNKKNRGLVGWLFRTLCSFRPRKKAMHVGTIEEFSFCEYDAEDEIEVLKKVRQQFVDTKRQVWKNFDAELDFIDNVLAAMD